MARGPWKTRSLDLRATAGKEPWGDSSCAENEQRVKDDTGQQVLILAELRVSRRGTCACISTPLRGFLAEGKGAESKG